MGKVGSPQWLDTKSFATANMWPYEGPTRSQKAFRRPAAAGQRLGPMANDVVWAGRIARIGAQSWQAMAPEWEALPDHYQQVLLDA